MRTARGNQGSGAIAIVILMTIIAIGGMGILANLPQKEIPISTKPVGTTNKVPDLRALFETTLASAITSTATSFTLTSATDKDGNSLASSTYAFIIDEGTASEEMVIADCTGTACTNVTRGISSLTGTTTVTALKKSHRRGASVKITDGPWALIMNRLIQGKDTFDNILSYTTSPTFTADGQIITKKYADNLANQGAATSTETKGGIVRLGTLAEQAISYNGGSTEPTVLQTKNSTSTCQVVGTYNIVASSTTGKLDKNCFDQAANYSLTGTHNFSATTTHSGINISGVASTTNSSTLQVNNLSIVGNIIGLPSYDWIQRGEIVATSSVSGIEITNIATSTDLRIIAYIPSFTTNWVMAFNRDFGPNAGGQQYTDWGMLNYNYTASTTNNSGGGALTPMGGFTTSATSTAYLIMDISNSSTTPKLMNWTVDGILDGRSNRVIGGGQWNDKTHSINYVSIRSASGVFGAGTRLTIYGKKD